MLKIIEHPGYLGKMREEIYSKWNKLYGNKWRLAWLFEDQNCSRHIIEKPEALQLYEDGYYEHLKANNSILLDLVDYEDVWDTADSNIHSHFDYSIQETPNNHIHDIAIRRAVMRLGYWFVGTKKELLHVRGDKTPLAPHMVPFHIPGIILPGEIKDYPNKGRWWRDLGVKFSIEEFYQHNKVLVVDE